MPNANTRASVQLFYIVVQNTVIYRVHAQAPFNKITKEKNPAKISHNVLSKFVSWCWATLIYILGVLGPQVDMHGQTCRGFQFSSFSFTDLKKTLAVLLDNILQRIGKLESKVDNLVNGTGANSTNSTTAVPSLVSLEKISVAGKVRCSLPSHGTETLPKTTAPLLYWYNINFISLA